MQVKSVNRTSVPTMCKSWGGCTEHSKGDTEHVERRRPQQRKRSRVKSSILTMARRCFDSPRRRPSQSLEEQEDFQRQRWVKWTFSNGARTRTNMDAMFKEVQDVFRKSSLLWLDHLPPSLCHNTVGWRQWWVRPLGSSPDSTAQYLVRPWMSNMTTPRLSFHNYKTEIQESLRDN